jgi:alkanesulfonate monooxygenase SsuD/methylene tetrahydromethanopterin reductase-like flavin-dependent oxidoreductase (luciferase family)
MFFTDYSMSAMELARALEERGFEPVWAPEHSHIPLSRKTPFPRGQDQPGTLCTSTRVGDHRNLDFCT